uniref:Uncharacterized protein n=1 Tax=Melopsittacus undulatus TaxID=13146 RepID=A0A8C6NCJ8_MELUD
MIRGLKHLSYEDRLRSWGCSPSSICRGPIRMLGRNSSLGTVVTGQGVMGPDCSEDINECDSEPCLNGATCYESVKQGQFVCICPPFYTGDFCHQRFSPCELPYNPCINNSTCLAQANGNPVCICKTGFEGTYCEINSDECISHPCQNEGLCVDGINHYRCSCQHGFTGTLCEAEINECSSGPCKNNGTCLDLVNRNTLLCLLQKSGNEKFWSSGLQRATPSAFICSCAPGYYGSLCEVNIDECMSTPCLNNGSCIDDISFYKCHCRRGFIGTNCEINECESAPCINGGFCQDAVNAFVCTCLSGYTGRFCEVDVDVCSEPALNSVLCYNGGVCVDGPGRTFHCRLV